MLSLAVSLGGHAAEPPQIVRVPAADPGVRAQLGQMFGHIDYDDGTGIATVEADAMARGRLSRLGLGWTVDETATAAMKAFVESGVDGLRAIPGYACYRTVEETFDTMGTLVSRYPALASIVDIGDSWRRTQDDTEGYPLRVLRLGNSTIAGTKPILFAIASIHAREYTPAELMTRFAEQLLVGYGVDADSTWFLDHNEFHLLLQANPDGRKRAEQSLSWRKNENVTHCPGDIDEWGNGPGVDLNRNFTWGWGIGDGSSSQSCSTTFRGPVAGSEPETQAIADYVRDIFPDRRPGDPLSPSIPADVDAQGLFLDMHSYSGLVMWPWGGAGTTGNNAAFTRLGRRLAWYNDYEPQQSVVLYPTNGTTIDFAFGELGVPALTFELGTQFFQNCTTFQNTILPDNLAALRYAARSLHAPYQLPAGPEIHGVSASMPTVVQGEPVEITATIDDRRYRNGAGAPPVIHTISGADVFVDAMPWQAGAAGLPMAALDGAFDQSSEEAKLVLDTGAMAPGRHLIVIQGHDAAGEHGPPSSVFLEIKVNSDIIFDSDFEQIDPVVAGR
jgi:carboxypeptidase T